MNTPTRLKPSAKLMELIEQQNCVYCGCTGNTLVMTSDGSVCCETCRRNKGPYESDEWLRKVKTTDQEYWNKLVENHRLSSTPIANLIRRIRVEG